jgi:hypothetical protein
MGRSSLASKKGVTHMFRSLPGSARMSSWLVATIFCTLATGLVPNQMASASTGDQTNVGHQTGSQPYKPSRVVPRSPGVYGITDPDALDRACPTYRFQDRDEYSEPTAFPGGRLSGTGVIFVVGQSWQTWNPQQDGLHVLYAPEGRYEVIFSSPVRGLILQAEPNAFGSYPVTVTAYDPQGRPLGSFTREIEGYAGAAYLGLISRSRPIKRVVISTSEAAAGFAFTNLTWGPNSCGK